MQQNKDSAFAQDKAAVEKRSDENGICEDNSSSAVTAGQLVSEESTADFNHDLPETAGPDATEMISNLPVATAEIADSAECSNTGVVPLEEQYIPAPVDEQSAMSSMVNESDIEFFRLGIVPENIVASLFLDDDNAAANGQSAMVHDAKPPTMSEPRKGFVAGDHPDAVNWFYQDPQGVIQGRSEIKLLKHLVVFVYTMRFYFFVDVYQMLLYINNFIFKHWLLCDYSV